jgi:hypothetical protein
LKIGHFLCTYNSEIFTKKNLKVYLDFQRKYPSSVILCFDYNLYISNQFSLKCFKFSSKILDLYNQLFILDDNPDIFKKFLSSSDILNELVITLKQEPYSLYSSISSNNSISNQTAKNENNEFSINKKLYVVFIIIGLI